VSAPPIKPTKTITLNTEIRKKLQQLQTSSQVCTACHKPESSLIINLDVGFIPAKFTPGLFKHITRPISFSLVVDDFGVKYINKEDVEYLI